MLNKFVTSTTRTDGSRCVGMVAPVNSTLTGNIFYPFIATRIKVPEFTPKHNVIALLEWATIFQGTVHHQAHKG